MQYGVYLLLDLYIMNFGINLLQFLGKLLNSFHFYFNRVYLCNYNLKKLGCHIESPILAFIPVLINLVLCLVIIKVLKKRGKKKQDLFYISIIIF